MSQRSYDVIVAKEYEARQDGQVSRKTAWNRVGLAWNSKSGDFLCFELFLIPGQRYVIALKPKESGDDPASVDFPIF